MSSQRPKCEEGYDWRVSSGNGIAGLVVTTTIFKAQMSKCPLGQSALKHHRSEDHALRHERELKGVSQEDQAAHDGRKHDHAYHITCITGVNWRTGRAMATSSGRNSDGIIANGTNF